MSSSTSLQLTLPPARGAAVLAVAALSLLAACHDDPLAAPPPQPASVLRAATWQGSVYLGSSEVETAQIEQAAPGFAGWYRDASGQVVVRVKAGGDAAAAVARVGRVAGAHAATRVEPARFTFLELAGFREVLRARLPPGVLSIDIDETSNVVRLGAADEASARRIKAAVALLGIPGAAVETRVHGPARLYASLNDALRPIRGGNSVRWHNDLPCTQGFNAQLPDGTQGFLTASHCTREAYRADGTPAVFHQPAILVGSSFRQVGTEHLDPTSFTGWPCYSNFRCRRSDAAFVRFSGISGTSVNGFNTIHRTAFYSWHPGASGSLEVTSTFNVVGDSATAKDNVVYKVGRTTGWTQGVVQTKCSDELVESAGQQFYILCSDLVVMHSGPGDSGSPVFTWDGVSMSVKWAGILFAGRDDGITLVSPVKQVLMDFPGISLFY